MNKKKCSTGLIAIIILSSLTFSTFIVKADSPRTVWGKVYIDGELAPDGITVKLTFLGQELTNDTYENGDYAMNFLEDNYEEGTFSVYYQEAWHSTNPPTVELGDEHELLYHVDLYVTTTPQENNPPDEPTLVSPDDGSTVDSTDSATLEVVVSDPDNDPMDVYFYNDSDDSLIGTATDVDSGDSAQVSWLGLSTNTTYHWYAVANDSQLETKSDTWSFNTSEAENKDPKVCIVKPQRALYIFNSMIRKYLFRFRIPLIFGKITIIANARDEDSGIERVEFYINGELKDNDNTEPYTYNWTWNRPRLIHIFCITVVAYDNEGATAEDCMIVRKFL
jgi:hypothetical protein